MHDLAGNSLLRYLTVALALLITETSLGAATRVAILFDSQTKAVPQAVSLAEALLSDDKGNLALIERQAIDQILNEQKITESLGGGDQSLVVGKLLSAEILAIVEPSVDAKVAAGLIIFDGEAGIRLEDVALPEDQQKAADVIAQRITAAVTKRNLPPDQRQSLCLMTVRNVDLPLELTSFVQASGKLLERRLTDSSSVTMLERTRLDKVNQERDLPTANASIRELAASVITLSLDVSRDGSDGVALNCLLSDASGKLIGSQSVKGAMDNIAKLDDQLADSIFTSLHSAPAKLVADRHAEARRYIAEARFRWAHQQRAEALQLAEAAAALDPFSSITRAARTRALIERGAELLSSFRDDAPADFSPKLQRNEEDTSQSLRVVIRGAELLVGEAQSTKISKDATKSMVNESPGFDDDAAIARLILRGYLTVVGCQVSIAPTPEGIQSLKLSADEQALLNQLRDLFRHLRINIEQPVAIAVVRDQKTFDAYSEFLFDLISDSTFSFNYSRAQWGLDLAALIPPWVQLADKYDSVSRFPNSSRHPMSPTGRAHEDAVGKILMSLENAWLNGQANWAGIDFPRERRPMGWGNFSDQELDRFDQIFAVVGTHHDLAFNRASDIGLTWVAKTRWIQKHPSQSRQQQRLPQLLATAVNRAHDVTSASGTGRDPLAEPGIFWKQTTPLIDVASGDQAIRTIFNPVISDGLIYCGAFSDEPTGPALELLRIDPATGQRTVLGKHSQPEYAAYLRLRPGTLRDRLSIKTYPCNGTLADGFYLVLDPSRTLLIFPLKGGDPIYVNRASGLGTLQIETATFLAGKIYAKTGDGLLIEFDPATGKYETLSSSQRKQHIAPFDDSPPFQVPVMIPDPGCQRIVFYAGSSHWAAGLCGVYEFNYQTRAFRQLLVNNKFSSSITQPEQAVLQSAASVLWQTGPGATVDTLINLTVNGWNATYSVQKDQAVPLPWVDVPRVVNEKVELVWPRASQGQWVWTGANIGQKPYRHAVLARIDSVNKRLQIFPSIRPEEISAGMWPVYLQAVDDQRMLIGDQFGLWLVTPPADVGSPDILLKNGGASDADKVNDVLPAGGQRSR